MQSFFLFKEKTAYELRISDWSSDVCSSDLKVIAFIEKYCVVPEGKLVGKPLKLEDFQKRFIREVYDNPKGTRRGFLSIARKNGKSGLIAAMVLAHIVGPEARLNAQIVSGARRSEEHTSELQSLMRISYAVFCLTKKQPHIKQTTTHNHH